MQRILTKHALENALENGIVGSGVVEDGIRGRRGLGSLHGSSTSCREQLHGIRSLI